MTEQPPHSEDVEPIAVGREAGELRVPHEQDNKDEQTRRLEKWQFRKSWRKFFGDVAATETVNEDLVEVPRPNLDQLNLEDYDKTLKWVTKGEKSPESAEEPPEKLYELRQEIKDAPTPVQTGASSVGKVMAEALNQRQANQPTQLAASEGLHRTVQKQSASLVSKSLYRQAVIIGVIGGFIVLGAMIVFNLLIS